MKTTRKYSHNRCINCKKKKLKCDERHPSCSGCLKRGVSCEYASTVMVYQPFCKRPPKGHKLFKEVDLKNSEQIKKKDCISCASSSELQASIDKFREYFYDRTKMSHQSRYDHQNEVIQESTSIFDVPSYVNFWGDYSEERLETLSQLLHKSSARGENVSLSEQDPNVQELIWLTFIHTKAAYNCMLIGDNYSHCIGIWFRYFSKKYAIIALVVNTIISNLLDVTCEDRRWFGILKRNIRITLDNLTLGMVKCESFPGLACYLLCIMFLFSERSAVKSDAWRAHLKGAYAILNKCDPFFNKISQSVNSQDEEMKNAINMYSFAKNWFALSETLACLSSPRGGAISDPSKFEECIKYTSDRPEDGFLLSGFNLMKCHGQSLTPVLAKLLKFIKHYSSEYGVILSGASGILHSIEHNSAYINLANDLLKDIDEVECEHFDFSEIEDYEKRAFMRICNISYCCAMRIYIYTVLMHKPIYGKDVQLNVQKIEESLVLVKGKGSFALCIHWPLFLSALCAPPGPKRTNLLIPINEVAQNGAYVARNTIERIELFWDAIDKGKALAEDYDCIVL